MKNKCETYLWRICTITDFKRNTTDGTHSFKSLVNYKNKCVKIHRK